MTEFPHNLSHAVMFHHFYDEKHSKGQGLKSVKKSNKTLVKRIFIDFLINLDLSITENMLVENRN